MVMICALAGCAQESTGTKVGLSEQFITIERNSEGILGEVSQYVYDKDTKIVYLYTFGGSHATMCPYYIIVDGAPQVAIYGETYK